MQAVLYAAAPGSRTPAAPCRAASTPDCYSTPCWSPVLGTSAGAAPPPVPTRSPAAGPQCGGFSCDCCALDSCSPLPPQAPLLPELPTTLSPSLDTAAGPAAPFRAPGLPAAETTRSSDATINSCARGACCCVVSACITGCNHLGFFPRRGLASASSSQRYSSPRCLLEHFRFERSGRPVDVSCRKAR